MLPVIIRKITKFKNFTFTWVTKMGSLHRHIELSTQYNFIKSTQMTSIKILLVLLMTIGTYSCGQTKNSDVSDISKSTMHDTKVRADKVSNDTVGLATRQNYIALLKDYLILNAENDEEIDSIANEEDGNIVFYDSEGGFLSDYYLKYSDVVLGDLDEDDISDAIVTVTNEGGGGGGNVAIRERYSIIHEAVSPIVQLQNVPKNKWGYEYEIKEILNGKVIIQLTFYKQQDPHMAGPHGESRVLSCRLDGENLIIVD